MSRRMTPRPGEAHVAEWNPLRDLLSLKERLNRLFEGVLKKGDFGDTEPGGWVPLADLSESDHAYRVTVELPGVRREEISIRLDSGILTIEGVRAPDPDSREAGHLRVERSHGPFSRTFHLPGPADQKRVEARFHLGLLEIVLPRTPGTPGGPLRIKLS